MGGADQQHGRGDGLRAGLRSWLTTYGGPLLGVLVVAVLLVNLAAQSQKSQPPTSSPDAAQVQDATTEDASERTVVLPERVTVTPDYSVARRVPSGPAQQVTARRTSPPTGLELSSGTTVPVRSVGTSEEGALDVPDDIETAGWWRGSARLGDPFGSMLIAAHVDSRTQGLGPYSVLLSVKPGAQFTVSGKEKLTQTFTVKERRVVARDKLASVPDIFSASGSPRLTMVTCAGPYEKEDGGYQNLAVVTAVPVGPATVQLG